MLASSLTDTHGIIAIAAAAIAVIALLWCVVLALALRRIRRAQSALLGGAQAQDLVEHAADLQGSFEALQGYTGEVAETLQRRLAEVESSLLSTISNRSLVRYDAYNELSGRQSMSIALLDDTRSGIVISCIHHRDQARVYAKRVVRGEGEIELSPEEAEAVRLADSTTASGSDLVGPAR